MHNMRGVVPRVENARLLPIIDARHTEHIYQRFLTHMIIFSGLYFSDIIWQNHELGQNGDYLRANVKANAR